MTHRAAILSALQSGYHRTREIAERTGIRREFVQIRLSELVRQRVVSSYRTLGGRHGLEKFYRIKEAA